MKGGLLLNKFLKGAGFYLLLLIIIVTIVEFAGTPKLKTDHTPVCSEKSDNCS